MGQTHIHQGVRRKQREMTKAPSHIRARRGNWYGAPRYDEEVWQCLEPMAERAKDFNPKWEELNKEMKRCGVEYYDEYLDKFGRR